MGQVILNRLSEPFNLTYQTVEATIESTNWEASGISGVVKNDVIFGGVTTSQETQNLFPNDVNGQRITANDFANLPPQNMTWSSTTATGPITITKDGGGAFTDKFVGSRVLVFDSVANRDIHYIITELTDNDNIIAYYQTDESGGELLSQTTYVFGGPSSNVFFQFVGLNFTGNPSDPQNYMYVETGFYNSQTTLRVNTVGAVKSAALEQWFNVPANTTSINGLVPWIDNGRNIPEGNIFYALIYNDNTAYVANSTGIRKIAKIENGTSYININDSFLDETWDQAGGDIRFLTVVALDQVQRNRVTATEWAQAQPLNNLQGITQVSLAMGFQATESASHIKSRGVILTYNVEVADTTSGFGTDNFFVLELNMDETTIGDAADIETAWANIKYYEVLGTNEIRFFAPANSVTDVPIIAKVIK
jgi:hypothetical protein